MADRQPHIVFITMDELRKDALGCYGNQTIRTTHLDHLARKSIRFEKAYTVSPWCLPARCAILTGLLPHNSGAYSNFRKGGLSSDLPNLFTELKKNGYRTSVHGKCHFAPVPYEDTRPDLTLPYNEFRNDYMRLGIDHLDLQDDKQVSVWFYDDYAKELDRAGYLKAYRDKTWDAEGNGKIFSFPGPEEWHPDNWVGKKAREYIENYDDEHPLFCWVSFSGPHYPFDPPASYLSKVDMSKDKPRIFKEGEYDDERRIHYRSYHGDGRGIADGSYCAPGYAQKNYSESYWRHLRKSYYANVMQIDENIGMILESVDRKFGDNVLIIFTADHGEMLGNHGIWGKGDCGYEDVLNVPLFVRYPGEAEGQSTKAKVMLTDIMPTCLKAANARTMPQTDGNDLKEMMSGGGYDYVFSEGEGFVTVSNGRWKYIHVRKGDREHDELFDLEKDPNEMDNVVDHPEYAREFADLRGAMINRFMSALLS